MSGELLPDPRAEGTVQLPDRREIGYASWGPEGVPTVLWFHGTPGARRQVPPAARRLAEDEGVRVVGIERPGVGASTTHLYDRVRDFSTDLDVVADRLGVDRFGVIGLSGGGPYALAVAHDHPDRIPAAVVLGGVAPTRGDDAAPGGLVDLAHRFRGPLQVARRPLGTALTVFARAARPVDRVAGALYARVSPEGDRRAFEVPGMMDMFLDDLSRGAAGHGLTSVANDVVLFTRHWGFDVGDIAVPVHLWHGDADHIVPLDHARHLVERIPGATLTIRPEESHLGTLVVGDEAVRAVLREW